MNNFKNDNYQDGRSFYDGNHDGEMSMDDILSSIRKYVSDEDSNSNIDSRMQKNKQNETDYLYSDREQVVKLDASHIINNNQSQKANVDSVKNSSHISPTVYEEESDLSGNVSGIQDIKKNKTSDDINSNSVNNSTEKKSSPFAKLASALSSYSGNQQDKKVSLSSSSLTIDQLFKNIATQIVNEWINNNMESIVKDIVQREIDKMKSE